MVQGMSGTKSADFRKYREIAPPSVDDAKIVELIEKHGKNADAINSALDNMWNSKFFFMAKYR